MKTKVSKEVAIKDLIDFLKPHKKLDFKRGKITADTVIEEYKYALDAIEDGLLTFKNKVPVYTLSEPLKDTDGKDALTVVTFRSRIHPTDFLNVMNNVRIDKEQGTYMLRLMAMCTQVSVGELQKIDAYDYKVLDNITSVFQ